MRTHDGEELVDGTCSTLSEYHYWRTGRRGITLPVHRAADDFCMDGDDEGCELMRQDGRCPYNAIAYARIRVMRNGHARKNHSLAVAWGRR